MIARVLHVKFYLSRHLPLYHAKESPEHIRDIPIIARLIRNAKHNSASDLAHLDTAFIPGVCLTPPAALQGPWTSGR